MYGDSQSFTPIGINNTTDIASLEQGDYNYNNVKKSNQSVTVKKPSLEMWNATPIQTLQQQSSILNYSKYSPSIHGDKFSYASIGEEDLLGLQLGNHDAIPLDLAYNHSDPQRAMYNLQAFKKFTNFEFDLDARGTIGEKKLYNELKELMAKHKLNMNPLTMTEDEEAEFNLRFSSRFTKPQGELIREKASDLMNMVGDTKYKKMVENLLSMNYLREQRNEVLYSRAGMFYTPPDMHDNHEAVIGQKVNNAFLSLLEKQPDGKVTISKSKFLEFKTQLEKEKLEYVNLAKGNTFFSQMAKQSRMNLVNIDKANKEGKWSAWDNILKASNAFNGFVWDFFADNPLNGSWNENTPYDHVLQHSEKLWKEIVNRAGDGDIAEYDLKAEGKKANDYFIQEAVTGFGDIVEENILSASVGTGMTTAGLTALATTGWTGIGAVAALTTIGAGQLISLTNALGFVDDMFGYTDNKSSMASDMLNGVGLKDSSYTLISLLRTLIPKVPKEVLEEAQIYYPEQYEKLIEQQKVAEMLGDDKFFTPSQIGATLGDVAGMVTMLFGRNIIKPLPKTLFTSTDYMNYMNKVNSIKQNGVYTSSINKVFANNKVYDAFLQSKAMRLYNAGKDKLHLITFSKPVTESTSKFYKAMSTITGATKEGFINFAIAEYLRFNPTADLDDIMMAGLNGSIFNIASIGLAKVVNKVGTNLINKGKLKADLAGLPYKNPYLETLGEASKNNYINAATMVLDAVIANPIASIVQQGLSGATSKYGTIDFQAGWESVANYVQSKQFMADLVGFAPLTAHKFLKATYDASTAKQKFVEEYNKVVEINKVAEEIKKKAEEVKNNYIQTIKKEIKNTDNAVKTKVDAEVSPAAKLEAIEFYQSPDFPEITFNNRKIFTLVVTKDKDGYDKPALFDVDGALHSKEEMAEYMNAFKEAYKDKYNFKPDEVEKETAKQQATIKEVSDDISNDLTDEIDAITGINAELEHLSQIANAEEPIDVKKDTEMLAIESLEQEPTQTMDSDETLNDEALKGEIDVMQAEEAIGLQDKVDKIDEGSIEEQLENFEIAEKLLIETYFGKDNQEVQDLLDLGYSYEEIVEMLATPEQQLEYNRLIERYSINKDTDGKVDDETAQVSIEELNKQQTPLVQALADELKKRGIEIEAAHLGKLLESNEWGEVYSTLKEVVDYLQGKYGVDGSVVNMLSKAINTSVNDLTASGSISYKVDTAENAVKVLIKLVLPLTRLQSTDRKIQIRTTINHEVAHLFQDLVVDQDQVLSKQYRVETDKLIVSDEHYKDIYDQSYDFYLNQYSMMLADEQGLDSPNELSDADMQKAMGFADKAARGEVHAIGYADLLSAIDEAEFYNDDTFSLVDQINKSSGIKKLYYTVLNRIQAIFASEPVKNARMLYDLLSTIKSYKTLQSKWGEALKYEWKQSEMPESIQTYLPRFELTKEQKDKIDRKEQESAVKKLTSNMALSTLEYDSQGLAQFLQSIPALNLGSTDDIIDRMQNGWKDYQSLERDLKTVLPGKLPEEVSQLAEGIFLKFDPSNYEIAEGMSMAFNTSLDYHYANEDMLPNSEIYLHTKNVDTHTVQNNDGLFSKDVINRKNLSKYREIPVGHQIAKQNLQKIFNEKNQSEPLLSEFVTHLYSSPLKDINTSVVLAPMFTKDGKLYDPESDIMLNDIDYAMEGIDVPQTTIWDLRTKRGGRIPEKAILVYPVEGEAGSILRKTNDVKRAKYYVVQDYTLETSTIADHADNIVPSLLRKGLTTSIASDKSISVFDINLLLERMFGHGLVKKNGNWQRFNSEEVSKRIIEMESEVFKYVLGSTFVEKLGIPEESLLLKISQKQADEEGNSVPIYKHIKDMIDIVHEDGKPIAVIKQSILDAVSKDKNLEKVLPKIQELLPNAQRILDAMHNTSVFLGSLNIADYIGYVLKQPNEKQIFLPIDATVEEVAAAFEISQEKAKTGLERALAHVNMNKIIGITDLLQLLAIDPSGSSLFYHTENGNKIKLTKYNNKYATFLKFDGAAPSFDRLAAVLENKGYLSKEGNNWTLRRGAQKYFYIQTVDDREELFTDAYVFDPDSWMEYAANLRKIVNPQDTDEVIKVNDQAKQILSVYADAIEQMVEILGEKSLDGGTITLNRSDLESNIHQILNMIGSAKNTSLKTRGVISNESGHFPLKHAMHPEYINLQDNIGEGLYGQKLMLSLFNGLMENGVGVVIVPSVMKGEGTYKGRKVAIKGKEYILDAKGNKLYKYVTKDKRVPINVRVKPSQVQNEDGQTQTIMETVPLDAINAKDTKGLVFDPMELGLANIFKDLGTVNNTGTLLSNLRPKISKEVLKGQSIPLQLTGKNGLAWDSQKGEAHSLSAGLPIRLASFSSASPRMLNVPDHLKDVLVGYGLTDQIDNDGLENHVASGAALLRSVMENFVSPIASYYAGYKALLNLSQNVSSPGQKVSEDFSNNQDLLRFLYDFNNYMNSKVSGDQDTLDELKETISIDSNQKSSLLSELLLLKRVAKHIKKEGNTYKYDTKDDDVDLGDRLLALTTLSDFLILQGKNSFTSGSDTHVWKFLRRQSYNAFRMRGKGSISILDSDRHAMADVQRGIEYAKENGYEVDPNILSHVDPTTGLYVEGSQGVSISKDLLEKHKWKIGDKVFVILTPSDSIQSFTPMIITGLLPEGKINTLTFNRKLALELLGRDHDIDTMSILGHDERWNITDGENTLNGFDAFWDIMTHNGIHKGSAKNLLVKEKRWFNDNTKIQNIKINGKKGDSAIPLLDDTQSIELFKNTLTKEKRPLISPLNVDDVIASRRKFSSKPIGEFASTGNSIGQFLGKFKDGLFVSGKSETGKDLSFRMKYDENSFDIWFPFQKEAAVDIFQKHPYMLDTGEWLAQFAVHDIVYDGKKYDLHSLKYGSDKAAKLPPNEFNKLYKEIIDVIQDALKREGNTGNPVYAANKGGMKAYESAKFDKYKKASRVNYKYTKGKLAVTGQRTSPSIDDVIMETLFKKTGPILISDKDSKMIKDNLEWMLSQEVVSLRGEIMAPFYRDRNLFGVLYGKDRAINRDDSPDPLIRNAAGRAKFDISEIDKTLSDAFAMVYRLLHTQIELKDSFYRYADLMNTVYLPIEGEKVQIEGMMDSDITVPFQRSVSGNPNTSSKKLSTVWYEMIEDMIVHGGNVDAKKNVYSQDYLQSVAGHALVKALFQTSLENSSNSMMHGRLFETNVNGQPIYTKDNPMDVGFAIGRDNFKVERRWGVDKEGEVSKGFYGLNFKLFVERDSNGTSSAMIKFSNDTILPLSELFSGNVNTAGLHPEFFKIVTDIAAKMHKNIIDYGAKNKINTHVRNLHKPYLHKICMDYVIAETIDAMIAGGYGEGKIVDGKPLGKLANPTGEYGPIAVRPYSKSGKEKFIRNLLANTVQSLASLHVSHGYDLTYADFQDRMTTENEHIQPLAKNVELTNKEIDDYVMLQDILIGHILTSVPSTQGITGVMRMFDNDYSVNGKTAIPTLFNQFYNSMSPEHAKTFNKMLQEKGLTIDSYKEMMYTAMYTDYGNADLTSLMNDYINNAIPEGRNALPKAETLKTFLNIINVSNKLIRTISENADSILENMSKQKVDDIILSEAMYEQQMSKRRQLIQKLYTDSKLLSNTQGHKGNINTLHNLEMNKVFGLTERGKAVFAELMSKGFNPKIMVYLTPGEHKIIDGKVSPDPGRKVLTTNYLEFMSKAANKLTGDHKIDKTHKTTSVTRSYKDLSRYELDDMPSRINHKLKGTRKVVDILNKGVNKGLTLGGTLVPGATDHIDFKKDLNKFLQGKVYSDGTQMSFGSIFHSLNRIGNEEDRKRIGKAIQDFTQEVLANSLNLTPIEKSRYIDLLNQDFGDYGFKGKSPDDHFNMLAFNMLSQMMTQQTVSLQAFDSFKKNQLKPFMNQIVADIYQSYKYAKNMQKAKKKFIRNIDMHKDMDSKSLIKILSEANILEMNTPESFVRQFSTQMMTGQHTKSNTINDAINQNNVVLAWKKLSVNESGELEFGDQETLTMNLYDHSKIIPDVTSNIFNNFANFTPHSISTGEKILHVQAEMSNLVRNQKVLTEQHLININSLTKDLSPEVELNIQQAENIIAKHAKEVFSNSKIKFKKINNKIHPYIEHSTAGENGVIVIEGSKTGIGGFEALADIIYKDLLNSSYKPFKDEIKSIDENTLKIALQKFLLIKLYNAQKGAVAKEHKSIIEALIQRLRTTDAEAAGAIAKGMSGYLRDLEIESSVINDFTYIPRKSVSAIQEFRNLTTITESLLSAISDGISYKNLDADDIAILKTYGRMLGFKNVTERNYAKVVTKILDHYNGMKSKVLEDQSTMNNDGLYEILKFNSTLNENIGSRMQSQILYALGVKQNKKLLGITNSDSLYKHESDSYSRFDKAIGELLTHIYLDDTRKYQANTGIAENPLVVEEVLYSLSHLTKSRLIYNNTIDKDNINTLEIGTPIQIFTSKEAMEEDTLYSDNNVYSGYYIGSKDKYHVIHKNGQLSFVPKADITSVRTGETSTTLDKEILNTMSKVFRQGYDENIISRYLELHEVNKNIDNSKLAIDQQLKQLSRISESKKELQDYITMQLAQGSNFALQKAIKAAPSTEISLGYLGMGKVVQTAVGLAGGLISFIMGSPKAAAMLGFGVEGATQFTSNIFRRILQNLSNFRGVIEFAGFRAALNSIGAVFKDSLNAKSLSLHQKTETFTESEIESTRLTNQMKNSQIKDTIKLLKLASSEMKNILDVSSIENEIKKGKITKVDTAALVATALTNLKRRQLEKTDGISNDILETIDSLQYDPDLKEFITAHGYDIASLMQMRRSIWEQAYEGLSVITSVIPKSEEFTRQGAHKAILETLTNKGLDNTFTDRELIAMTNHILNISGGQYGKATRTRFGNTALGRSLTMYGRFNKNNAVYFLNHIWDKISEQLLLSELQDINPSMYEVNDEGVPMLAGIQVGLREKKILNNDKVTTINETAYLGSEYQDFNYLRSMTRKVSLGMAIQATSLATRVGLKMMAMALFGSTFSEIFDEMFENKQGVKPIPQQIDEYLALSGAIGEVMELSVSLGSLAVYREGDDLARGDMTKSQFKRMWMNNIKSPTNFLFSTGIGSGYSAMLGSVMGFGLNTFGYTMRDQFDPSFNLYKDVIEKDAYSNLIDMFMRKIPIFSPVYNASMITAQGAMIGSNNKTKSSQDIIKDLVFEK